MESEFKNLVEELTEKGTFQKNLYEKNQDCMEPQEDKKESVLEEINKLKNEEQRRDVSTWDVKPDFMKDNKQIERKVLPKSSFQDLPR